MHENIHGRTPIRIGLRLGIQFFIRTCLHENSRVRARRCRGRDLRGCVSKCIRTCIRILIRRGIIICALAWIRICMNKGAGYAQEDA